MGNRVKITRSSLSRNKMLQYYRTMDSKIVDLGRQNAELSK